jgi:hypothetical protein
MPEQANHYVSIVVIVAGLVALAWGQRSYLRSAASYLASLAGQATSANRSQPDSEPAVGLTPSQRFERFYELRTWCESAGQAGAVKALDSVVLPAIVQAGKP